jgi:hypothetical protein
MITNDATYTREIKYMIVMGEATFNKRQTLLKQQIGLNLRRKLVKRYIWSIALCCAETSILRKGDRKYLESFEMWCWRRLENIS